MPTIPFLSRKGGVGKTTSALLFATLFAKIDDVTLIDADPNRSIDWPSGDNVPPRLNMISDINEKTITGGIQDAASKSTFVIVDLEGAVSKIVLYAIAEVDFVVIPTQGSHLNAKQASRAIRVVMQSKRMTRRSIPYARVANAHGGDGTDARQGRIFRRPFRKPASCQRSASTKDNRGPMGLS